MTQNECEIQVLELVRKEVHPSVELDTRLVDDGILDSFHTLKLVTHLEDMYSIRLELSEIAAEDVATVRAIASLILRVKNQR